MAHNPKKLLSKILNDIDVSVRKINGAPDDVAGGFYLNKLTGGMVKGNLEESMKYINHLLDRISKTSTEPVVKVNFKPFKSFSHTCYFFLCTISHNYYMQTF